MCIPPNHGSQVLESEALVRRYFEMWSTGEGAVADAVLGPGYLDHAQPGVLGPAAVRSLVPRFRAAHPDADIAFEILGADGDLVAARATIRRSRDGALRETQGVALFRVGGARLVEQWSWHRASDDETAPSSPSEAWAEAQRRIRGEGARSLADMFAPLR